MNGWLFRSVLILHPLKEIIKKKQIDISKLNDVSDAAATQADALFLLPETRAFFPRVTLHKVNYCFTFPFITI